MDVDIDFVDSDPLTRARWVDDKHTNECAVLDARCWNGVEGSCGHKGVLSEGADDGAGAGQHGCECFGVAAVEWAKFDACGGGDLHEVGA